MAENRGVWGIDIGQAGLKAVRLRYAEAANQVLAVAFDYVPHPKILSQPDAVPEELIPQALEKFLSRNDIHGDAVAISVPGQTALARFIQLPPVQANKVADIVKYEARQQIPFALEEVIWDFQLLSGGSAESDFMIDAEVGLFAMKREQVHQHLRPYLNQKVEVDLIQIAPLALYNVLSYDLMGLRLDGESEPTDEYTILVDMGADNTMLLVSNGAKIWIRNVPIGGNHFTRALTKEMKLTFAKAEHLKCNATKSPDPKAVFQALRPVFNEYVSEIQRSIGYFSSVNRNAKITKVVGLGNGFKLAGLQKFLQQNLQYPVERLDRFPGLAGDAVLNAPLFEENILSFAVPYGLALQQLGLTRIHTTLLPPEIRLARQIRRKKPWAVAAAAMLMLGFSASAVGYSHVARSVSTERFGDAESAVEGHSGKVSSFNSQYNSRKGENENLKSQQTELLRPLGTREHWLEVYKAINEALPRDEGELDLDDLKSWHGMKLTSVTTRKMADLSEWFEELGADAKERLSEVDQKPPSGPGYVFTVEGLHYHDDPANPYTGQGANYVEATLLENLKEWQRNGALVRGAGVTHATILEAGTEPYLYDPENPQRGGGGRGGFGPGGYGPGMEMPFGGEGVAGTTDPSEMYRHMGPMGGVGPMGPMGGVGPGAAGGLRNINPTELLERSREERKPRKTYDFQETWFVVQFAWQPIPADKRPVYDALSDYFFNVKQDAPEDGTYAEAQEHVKEHAGRELAQEDFDDFFDKHVKKADEAG